VKSVVGYIFNKLKTRKGNLKRWCSGEREGDEQVREVGIKLRVLGDIYSTRNKEGKPHTQASHMTPLKESP